MASQTKQQHLQQQPGKQQSAFGSHMSVLAQAKPAIVSPSPAPNSFNIPTGALSEKINTALNLSSTALSQQERTDISKLFSNYNNDGKQQSMQRAQQAKQQQQHIEDDTVLMKQNASNQMRQAAVLAAVASQQKVRLSATERLAMTAKRPPQLQASAVSSSSIQSRQTTTDGSNASSTPLASSKSASSLPTLETLLAVQRQLQQHTRQNLNSVPQHQMVNTNTNADKPPQQQQQEAKLEAPPKHQNSNSIKVALSQQNSNESSTHYQPHAQCKKPLPPSPPKSPSLAQQASEGPKCPVNQQCSVSMSYEKELPPLPQSVSPSTTGTTSDDSQMNSLESHQSSPATSLVSIPPPPPPISSYLEQYDEVNSACRQSNSSTPSTIATSEVSSAKLYSFTQNHPVDLPPVSNENQYQNHQQYDSRPKPPALAPKPAHFNYQRVLQNQTNHFSEINKSTGVTSWTDSHHNQALRQPQQVAAIKRDLSQLHNSYSLINSSKIVSDSDSNESSSAASNNSYDVSYKPQLNYQQHVFTRTSASLPSMPMPPPPPPPSGFSSQQQTNVLMTSDNKSGNQTSAGFDELDSAFRFPTPPPLDMLLEDDDDGDVKKPALQNEVYDDDDFQCRIPTPTHQKSMSTVSFQDLHTQQRVNQRMIHRQESISPPTFNSTINCPPPKIQPPASFRPSNHVQDPRTQQPQLAPTATPTVQTTNASAVSIPQLTVHISSNNNDESGLLSTTAAVVNHPNNLLRQSSVNHHHHHHGHHHNHMVLTRLPTSSSSPSSSSDGDGHSSNSSSSTSGIHSSIDSPSSSNSKLDDFNYSASKLRENVVRHHSSCLPNDNTTNNNLKNNSSKSTSSTTISRQHHFLPPTGPGVTSGGVCGSSGLAPHSAASQTTTTIPPPPTATTTIIKPALKQKKTVSFSDKVELVACAEEQCEDHLPNPLLARVLAGKLQ